MACRINSRGFVEFVDAPFARAAALELIERCNEAVDRADEFGGCMSESAERAVRADYQEAAALLQQLGELGGDGLSDGEEQLTTGPAHQRAFARRTADVYQQLAPPMDSVTPAADSAGVAETPETGSVTVKAIPGSGGYYVVLGRGGPAQFASHTAAEAEARRRVGSRQ